MTSNAIDTLLSDCRFGQIGFRISIEVYLMYNHNPDLTNHIRVKVPSNRASVKNINIEIGTLNKVCF